MYEREKLLSDLKSKNDDIRLNAVRALEKYKEADIPDYLVELLSDYNPDVRTAVAMALSKIGNERAVHYLIKALADTNKDTRKAAAIALGKIGDYRALSNLRGLSRLDHNEEVRKAALLALDEIDKSLAEMLSKLEQELGSPQIEDRKRAIKFLTTIGTKDAVSVLLKAVINPDNQIQISALEALDKVKSLVGVEPFLKGLKSEHWKIRMSCVEFLGRSKDQEVLEPIIDLLDTEEDPQVKKSIAYALGEMGLEDSLYHLRNMLNNSEPEVTEVALKSIVQIGGDQSIEYLIGILRDEEGKIALLAEEGLIRYGYKMLPLLIEDFYEQNEKSRNTSRRIIKQIRNDATDYFLQLLSNPDPKKRKLGVEFLGELESKNSIEALTEIAEEDTDRDVKKTAARVVGKLSKKFKISSSPSFRPSESLLHRFSTFFSDQIEKISKVKKPSLAGLFKGDRLICGNCGGIISRRASTVDLDKGRVEIMRFGLCPLCDRIYCKGCATGVVVRGLTVIKCPNCNVELNPV